MRKLAVQFLALADKQRVTGPLTTGHRLMGLSLLHTGDIAEGRVHLDRAITLYDSAEHVLWRRVLDKTLALQACSGSRWLLGCSAIPRPRSQTPSTPSRFARETGHSVTLIYVLNSAPGPISTAGIMRRQTRLSMNLSL